VVILPGDEADEVLAEAETKVSTENEIRDAVDERSDRRAASEAR
jgi:regulator of RNase E activity RraA